MAERATGDPVNHGNYRNLEAWVVSMDLAAAIFGATRVLRPEDEFTLGVQLRRAALSVRGRPSPACFLPGRPP